MSLNMHGTQYGLSQHNKLLQNVELYLVVQLNVKMQRKMGLFALYSVCCNVHRRLTSSML